MAAPAMADAVEGPAGASTRIEHVVLLSVDGLHTADLYAYTVGHPGSTLARLVRQGRSYSSAMAPFPSDSVPGLLAQLTGGRPAQTGVYYDDSYSRALLPAGTTRCDRASSGAEVALVGSLDRDPKRLDAGQGIPGLYDDLARISALTGQPAELLDPRRLPVDPNSCAPLLPHRYLRVNTVFDVAHRQGLRTAWADKHPAYEILEGPGGHGVDDLFAPEIDASRRDPSGPEGAGTAFPDDNTATQFYDALKVQAVLNWIAGKDHGGSSSAAVPAILGMNFQAVSTAQKLNHSDYFRDPADPATLVRNGAGGYIDGGRQPGPVLQGALQFIDQQLTRIVAAIDAEHTALILSAKHGQSPRDRGRLLLIDDRAMLDALDGAWAARSGRQGHGIVAHAVDDDGVLLWLNDRSSAACRFAARFLTHYSGIGIGADQRGEPVRRPFHGGGLRRVY
ncbi:MAG: alkaline phosphatase family protein, partial [Gammaproteobacteria bacterium]|nr:alkaline phosphatase family protein [Gammaproteobacteria bacterium]